MLPKSCLFWQLNNYYAKHLNEKSKVQITHGNNQLSNPCPATWHPLENSSRKTLSFAANNRLKFQPGWNLWCWRPLKLCFNVLKLQELKLRWIYYTRAVKKGKDWYFVAGRNFIGRTYLLSAVDIWGIHSDTYLDPHYKLCTASRSL